MRSRPDKTAFGSIGNRPITVASRVWNKARELFALLRGAPKFCQANGKSKATLTIHYCVRYYFKRRVRSTPRLFGWSTGRTRQMRSQGCCTNTKPRANDRKGGCAINCRYCFRRHFPYQDNKGSKISLASQLRLCGSTSRDQRSDLVWRLQATLSDGKGQRAIVFIHAIEQIPHVKNGFIHSRLPVVIPARGDLIRTVPIVKAQTRPAMCRWSPY